MGTISGKLLAPRKPRFPCTFVSLRVSSYCVPQHVENPRLAIFKYYLLFKNRDTFHINEYIVK